MAPSSRPGQAMGQVIEYIPDRLYLAAYIHPPTPDTPLGAQTPSSPRKRAEAGRAPCYFTIDDSLLYNAFHHDFGPLHIGHLYRFAICFHDVLGARENKERPVVFWSAADARSRANAACMLACYMVLIQNWPPHLALAPIAQVDPPLMPFRDAGYSQADYGLSVQDVVYGVWRAKEEKCCDLENFDLDLYERFERVEHGDFNWITPHFLAFASPQHRPDPQAQPPRDRAAVDADTSLPQPFRNVLDHFAARRVGLVVRLNSPLYEPAYFEALGIRHLDMIFDDGTCPPLATVRRFIRLAHETITVRHQAIAVHCKAGLGRTGCLIGAYLIYRHGFTANEVIAFMRFMRPGMVVGPQQHWLHLNQGTFRDWGVEERVERRLHRELAAAALALPTTPVRAMHKASLRSGAAHVTPSRSPSATSRTPLSEVEPERSNVGALEDCLPAPTPGQPRKATARVAEPVVDLGVLQRRRRRRCSLNDGDGGDHVDGDAAGHDHGHDDHDGGVKARQHARVRSQRRPSPGRCGTGADTTAGDAKFSLETTTAICLVTGGRDDASLDTENLGAILRAKQQKNHHYHYQPACVPSASGVLTKVRGTGRRAAAAAASAESPLRAKEMVGGVRKLSGRVGSASAAPSAVAMAVATARKVSGS